MSRGKFLVNLVLGSCENENSTQSTEVENANLIKAKKDDNKKVKIISNIIITPDVQVLPPLTTSTDEEDVVDDNLTDPSAEVESASIQNIPRSTPSTEEEDIVDDNWTNPSAEVESPSIQNIPRSTPSTDEEDVVDDNLTDPSAEVESASIQNIPRSTPSTDEESVLDDDLIDPDYENFDESTTDGSGADDPEPGVIRGDAPEQKKCTGRPEKGRKRKHPHQTEKIRKLLKDTNKPFISKRGKEILSKKFVDYHCTCKEQCHEKISVEQRKLIFEKFWSIGTYDLQTAFLNSLVQEEKIKRRRVQVTEQSRKFKRTYKFEDCNVCREIFTKTLQISTKRVNTALKKSRSLILKDLRGKHKHHNKISDERKNQVIQHINSIPRYKSHYRRSQSDREYLPSDMTLERMYKLYTSEAEVPVSFSFYKKIFYTYFNITRKPLKKDTCNKCDAYSAQAAGAGGLLEKEVLQNDHHLHLKEAEDARQMMKNDFQRAKTVNNIETLTFDLEKTLPIPRLPTNIIFYKRQLWLYNLGIHAAKENEQAYCFLWPEGLAGRGAQEVGSCLMAFIKNGFLHKDITELILWSDSCGGQNRNIKLTLLLRHILKTHPTLQNIHIRFLVSGHSFLPNDSDFSHIEKALQLQQRLYTPQDYINIMQTCKRTNPFIVYEMKREDFKSSSGLEKEIVNRKKDIVGEKINWLKVKEIKLEKGRPFSIFFKFTHSEESAYTEVDIKPKQKGKISRPATSDSELDLLWPNGKPISSPKLNDLKALSHLIPQADQHFYNQLFSDETIEDDIDGYNGEVDFEFEDNI